MTKHPPKKKGATKTEQRESPTYFNQKIQVGPLLYMIHLFLTKFPGWINCDQVEPKKLWVFVVFLSLLGDSSPGAPRTNRFLLGVVSKDQTQCRS